MAVRYFIFKVYYVIINSILFEWEFLIFLSMDNLNIKLMFDLGKNKIDHHSSKEHL